MKARKSEKGMTSFEDMLFDYQIRNQTRTRKEWKRVHKKQYGKGVPQFLVDALNQSENSHLRRDLFGTDKLKFTPNIIALMLRHLKLCSYCRKLEERSKVPKSRAMKKCGRCKLVFYCDRKCQKRDWKVHKLMCKKQ